MFILLMKRVEPWKGFLRKRAEHEGYRAKLNRHELLSCSKHLLIVYVLVNSRSSNSWTSCVTLCTFLLIPKDLVKLSSRNAFTSDLPYLLSFTFCLHQEFSLVVNMAVSNSLSRSIIEDNRCLVRTPANI